MPNTPKLVDRVKALIAKHGAVSEALNEVRTYYRLWQISPRDPGAMGLLEAAVARLEAL